MWRICSGRRISQPILLSKPTPAPRWTMPHRARDTRGLLRQPLSDPNEGCRHRCGVAPFTLAVAIGEIEGQRRRVGVDDDLGPAEGARGVFRELEQNAAVAVPLEVSADDDEAKPCLDVAAEVHAH